MKAAPAGRVKAERSEPKGSLDTDAAPDTIVPGGACPTPRACPLGDNWESWMLEVLEILKAEIRG